MRCPSSRSEALITETAIVKVIVVNGNEAEEGWQDTYHYFTAPVLPNHAVDLLVMGPKGFVLGSPHYPDLGNDIHVSGVCKRGLHGTVPLVTLRTRPVVPLRSPVTSM